MRDSALPDVVVEESALAFMLTDEIAELESELAGAKEDRDAWEAEVKEERARVDAKAFDVLQAVRDWFDNVILFKRPMTDPRKIHRLVEDVLS